MPKTAPVATVSPTAARYTPAQRRHVAKLAREHNATRAREILMADNGTEDAALRNSDLFPEPTRISLLTVTKYAHAKGVPLRRGRGGHVAAVNFEVEEVAA